MSGQGFIYYIACPELARIKIGFTSGNPISRLRALQTGSPTRLILFAMHPGAMKDEQDLHIKFENSRLHGEWFDSTDDLVEHLAMICWLTAAEAQETNAKVPHWAKVGLEAMHLHKCLPDSILAAIQ